MHRHSIFLAIAFSSVSILTFPNQTLAEDYENLSDNELSGRLVTCVDERIADPVTCPGVKSEAIRRASSPPNWPAPLRGMSEEQIGNVMVACREGMVSDMNMCTAAGEANHRRRLVSLVERYLSDGLSTGSSQAVSSPPVEMTIEDARSACASEGYPRSSAQLRPGGYSCGW